MTVRYMIVTDNGDGTTTHQVVATLGDAFKVLPDGLTDTDLARLRFAVEEHGAGAVGPVSVAAVVWRGRCYVRADVSGNGPSNELPLDNGMTTR